MTITKSETPKKKTTPDALVDKTDVELTEEKLSKVSGGLILDGIKGESKDHKL
ncbi:MAG TPA: hypothetical protein VFC15_15250 [Candidatus Limnocylindrales bacterium]|nr:hypothetical protein [Candidatus Limnocylindrales bacterium]